LEIQGNGFEACFGIFLAVRLTGKGGCFMVGEFVFLTDISHLCRWTNTILVTVACIPFILFALSHKIIPRRPSQLFKLEWSKDYFERGFLRIARPEADSQEKKRVEDGERGVQVLGVKDPQQSDINKQAG
jgi:hypothetical protein